MSYNLRLTTIFLLFTFHFSLFSNFAISQNSDIPIVPTPQIIKAGEGNFVLDNSVIIVIKGKDADRNTFAAQEIQNTLKEYCNLNIKLLDVHDLRSLKNQAKQIILEQSDSTSLADKQYPKFNHESYYLIIDKNEILIKAFKPVGIFYGAISLIQLLEKAKDNILPTLTIIDWPDMKMRGVSDDISRGQVSTLDDFKKIIRNLARYKMNVYMPYLEDMLQLDAYPSIGKGRGALSKQEVKELVDYAAKYFIDVIPVFQTLGHYENILSQDEFVKYAEFPGAASLNVSSDSTYTFLENMLKEVFEMFPSKYINIGADESYDVGLGKSKQLVEQYNQSEPQPKRKKLRTQNSKLKTQNSEQGIAIVHANHYKKVYDICKKYGKTVMMYSDIVLKYPKIIDLLPKDIIMVDWHYNPIDEYKSAKIFKDSSFKFLVSPSVRNYFTSFPNYALALPNIKYIIRSGIDNNSLGMVNSCWGDYGSETFRELNYFGYTWSAQCAWNLKASDISTFSRNYFYDFFGTDDTLNSVVYQALSEPENLLIWHELWRHPLLPFRPSPQWEGRNDIVVKTDWMNWTLPLVSKDLDVLQNKAVRNKDHYDILKYIIKLDNYFKYKVETQELLFRKMNNEPVDIISLLSMIDKNISMLEKLRDEYKSLWLGYYKEDNLYMIMDKFSRLIAYFSETKDEVIKDNLRSPLIKSDWIYLKKNNGDYADKAYFRNEFKLDNKPDSALLQLMGDTYAMLYINGQYVDRVYARSSLSLLVDYKRIKLIDITKYLKDSLNTIEVRCGNYNEKGNAGCNIYTEIYSKGKTLILVSDNTWSAKLSESDKWKNATVLKYEKFVIAPDFKNKHISWIER